jgi:methionyl-tRNA synthetase
MSKSKGNTIYADRLVGLFGADAVRHYVLSEMSFANDGSVTYEAIIDRFNSDLANTLGNLVSRTIAMACKYFDGLIPEPGPSEAVDNDLKSAAGKAVSDYDRLMETYHVAEAVEAVFELAHRSNKYIDETSPWILAKDEALKPRLATVIYNLLESIRILAVALSPFMPGTCEIILERLGSPEAGYDSLKKFGTLKSGGLVKTGEPLFVRIDAEKLLSEISAEETDEADGSGAGLIPISELISIDEFMKADLRVAEIKECEKLPKAKKLLVLKLDDGFGERQVVSGIAQWYSPDDLKGKKVIIAANLAPAVLCGVKSEGMIIAADVSDKAQVIFVDESLPNGVKLR